MDKTDFIWLVYTMIVIVLLLMYAGMPSDEEE